MLAEEHRTRRILLLCHKVAQPRLVVAVAAVVVVVVVVLLVWGLVVHVVHFSEVAVTADPWVSRHQVL